MFDPFIRVALITSLLCLPLTENIWHKNELVQTTIEQIKSSVESALPSDWKVIGERADQSLWPTVDTLRDRYKGYAIDLAGPRYSKESTVKGQTNTKRVSDNKTAVLYFIPVWSGITRAQLTRDLSEGQRAMDARFDPRGQLTAPSQQSESVIYGWNSQYLLVCKHDCDVVERVAKKFKIPKK
jgi:hypothetical protein